MFLVIYKKAGTVSPDSPVVLFLLASSSIHLVGNACVSCPMHRVGSMDMDIGF